MTVSELKYLMAVSNLIEDDKEAKMSAIARSLGVSKVSVYHGLLRLQEKQYLVKSDKKIELSDLGKQILSDYRTIIEFISGHLQFHCGTPCDLAREDAIGAACAFSDVSRKGVADFVKSGRNDR